MREAVLVACGGSSCFAIFAAGAAAGLGVADGGASGRATALSPDVAGRAAVGEVGGLSIAIDASARPNRAL